MIPQCIDCKHIFPSEPGKLMRCLAFPEKIPSEIRRNSTTTVSLIPATMATVRADLHVQAGQDVESSDEAFQSFKVLQGRPAGTDRLDVLSKTLDFRL